jgi:hypothetical protein
MNLPALIAKHSTEELLASLELIEVGGPFEPRHIQLVRNLHTFRYADVKAHESRYEDGIHTDIIAAKLTDRGRALLDELRTLDAESRT